MEFHFYHYHARLVKVYDGDTCHLDIDLGFKIWSKKEKIRLARINAPELKGATLERAQAARDFLEQKLKDKLLVIETIRDRQEKYGRYLAEIWFPDETDNWVNINDLLVQNGLAIYVKY
jgi:micrococcal nuclease